MLNIGLLGFGRMGQAVLSCINNQPHFTCTGIKVRAPQAHEKTSVECDEVVKASDVLIDFSAPNALAEHLEAALRHAKPLVYCVTGLNAEHYALILEASHTIPICLAPNTSLAVIVMEAMTGRAATILSDTYDIEIFEAHHRGKVDAPSGTALMLGEAAAKGRGDDLSSVHVYPHQSKRQPGQIGFSVARGGGIGSEHTVHFYGDDDVLSFTHRSLNRTVYAKGALTLANILVTKTPGLYAPKDLLLND